jgi:hypothetical protein
MPDILTQFSVVIGFQTHPHMVRGAHPAGCAQGMSLVDPYRALPLFGYLAIYPLTISCSIGIIVLL